MIKGYDDDDESTSWDSPRWRSPHGPIDDDDEQRSFSLAGHFTGWRFAAGIVAAGLFLLLGVPWPIVLVLFVIAEAIALLRLPTSGGPS